MPPSNDPSSASKYNGAFTIGNNYGQAVAENNDTMNNYVDADSIRRSKEQERKQKAKATSGESAKKVGLDFLVESGQG